MLLTSMEI